jgi:Peptidase A4 family
MDMAKVQLPGGVKVRTFTPAPEGFDPLKADDASLALHGAPPRPIGNPELLAMWEKAVGRITKYVEPSFQPVEQMLRTRRGHESVQPDNLPTGGIALPTASATAGFIGGVLPALASAQINFVTGTFTLPDLNNSDYPCIIAVSLDRFTPFPLVVGLYCVPPSGSNFGSADDPAWYMPFWAFGYEESLEIITMPGPLPLPFPVSVGDTISIFIAANDPSDPEANINIYFSNGEFATSFAASPPQGVVFTGQDAAWTVEPMNPGTLPSFGTLYFSGLLALEKCGSDVVVPPITSTSTTVYTHPAAQPQCVAQVQDGEVVCTSP